MDEDLMRSIDDAAKSVTSNIDLRRFSAAQTDAHDLQSLLKQVEAFYIARPDKPDALEFARTSLGLTDRIEQSAAARDFDAASLAAAQLARSCRACHDVYKPL